MLEVLDSGALVQGPKVAELERRFAALVGVEHAVATSSGTTALHLALLAHGLGPGDEVITTPFTFVASANAILYVGARPVFVDVEDHSFNLDPAAVEAAITPRTRAILPVHLYGRPADMAGLTAVAGRHGLAVIEDCAQAVGATYRGRQVGSFGTGCFSLYATKNVTSVEGGVITTDDGRLADQVRLLRNQGMRARYRYEALGYNYRLSDVHAALGVCQMDRLEEFTARRRANARRLNTGIHSVTTPADDPDYGHVWHQYTIRINGSGDRGRAIRALAAAGIQTGIFYPEPVHLIPYVREAAGEFRLPVAERLAREVVSLPVHPGLEDEDVERILAGVNRL